MRRSGFSTSSLRPFLRLALAGSLLTGCVLSAEAELADVEVATKGIVIPAAPAEADSDDVSVTVQFKQKPNRAGLAKENFRDVHVLGLALVANSGIVDLGFLRTLHVTATTKETVAAGKAPVEIVRYMRPAGTPTDAKPPAPVTTASLPGPTVDGGSGAVGANLTISADPPADITELWRSSEIEFTLEVAGRLPPVSWTADVGLRLGATLTY
jgi:hypothetical protein